MQYSFGNILGTFKSLNLTNDVLTLSISGVVTALILNIESIDTALTIK
jgi:hypothetical protein